MKLLIFFCCCLFLLAGQIIWENIKLKNIFVFVFDVYWCALRSEIYFLNGLLIFLEGFGKSFCRKCWQKLIIFARKIYGFLVGKYAHEVHWFYYWVYGNGAQTMNLKNSQNLISKYLILFRFPSLQRLLRKLSWRSRATVEILRGNSKFWKDGMHWWAQKIGQINLW